MNSITVIKKIEVLKKKKKKIGLCHGVFDVLHYGHLLHFESAKKKCDYLFVSVTSDKYVNKGSNRPVHSQNERIYFLNNLKFIDCAFIAKGESAVESINLIKPNFYFKGNDYKNNFLDKTKKIFKEKKAVIKNSGKIIYTDEKQMSSSKIINQLNLASSDQQTQFLKKIKSKFDYKVISSFFKNLMNEKVLVVGDLIIDKYVFGSVLGKSGKEPHMVFSEKKTEIHLGGSSAIANHLSDFIKKITLITDLSNDNSIKNLLKKKLGKNINLIPVQSSNNKISCIKSTLFVFIRSLYPSVEKTALIFLAMYDNTFGFKFG